MSFQTLKWLSFAHSAVYLMLLVASLTDSSVTFLGWAHGIGWIAMSLLCIAAVRRNVIPLWLAVTVVVIGAVGPFAGSIGFVVEQRRRRGGIRARVQDGSDGN